MHATATATEISAFTLKANDVLITKDSELWEDIAVPALVRADLEGVLCGYHLALIRSDQNLLIGEYLFQAFSTPVLARQFSIAATGVTRYGLSKHAIKNAVFLLPPLNEQEQICRWIKDELQPIYASIERAQREINLIREYRTRLIADVVTGKLDVRHLPVEKIDEALEDIEEVEAMEVLEAFEDQGEEEEDESSQTC
jgi:type I restriction enzyme S subunit